MLKSLTCAAVMFAAAAGLASAQESQWEVGAIGGVGFSPDMTVKNGSASASASVRPGLTVGAYGGQDMYRYWSGEVNYLYREGDLKLSGNGQSARFAAHTHLITGDFLAHFKPRGAHIRPFVSFGGGVEVMEGTGQEAVQSAPGKPSGAYGHPRSLAGRRSGSGRESSACESSPVAAFRRAITSARLLTKSSRQRPAPG